MGKLPAWPLGYVNFIPLEREPHFLRDPQACSIKNIKSEVTIHNVNMSLFILFLLVLEK